MGRALLASLGQWGELSWLDESSSVLMRVIRLCRYQLPDLEVPVSAAPRFDALPYQVAAMRDLVEELAKRPLDITLLKPLPPLVFPRG